MTIAIDFDGTIVADRFPLIGEFRPGAVATLRALREDGHTLILWTCRTGLQLAQAVQSCAEAGIHFHYINQNRKEHIALYGGDTRKIFADIYIDDKAHTSLPQWNEIHQYINQKNISK